MPRNRSPSASRSPTRYRPPSSSASIRRASSRGPTSRRPRSRAQRSSLSRSPSPSSPRSPSRGRGRSFSRAKSEPDRKKVPLGFLAAIGVAAVVVHRYWPKGWIHGDLVHWDKLGRSGDAGVREGSRSRSRRGSLAREGHGRERDGFRQRRFRDAVHHDDGAARGRGGDEQSWQDGDRQRQSSRPGRLAYRQDGADEVDERGYGRMRSRERGRVKEGGHRHRYGHDRRETDHVYEMPAWRRRDPERRNRDGAP